MSRSARPTLGEIALLFDFVIRHHLNLLGWLRNFSSFASRGNLAVHEP
jgi:hypothetical protein